MTIDCSRQLVANIIAAMAPFSNRPRETHVARANLLGAASCNGCPYQF